MSLTKPSTSESESSLSFGPGVLSSSAPMTVTVSLPTMRQALQARRRSLVKKRRNYLAEAARERKKGKLGGPAEHFATTCLSDIREVDAKLGLLSKLINESTTRFTIDLRDPDLVDLGFGMDDNGNYPAL